MFQLYLISHKYYDDNREFTNVLFNFLLFCTFVLFGCFRRAGQVLLFVWGSYSPSLQSSLCLWNNANGSTHRRNFVRKIFVSVLFISSPFSSCFFSFFLSFFLFLHVAAANSTAVNFERTLRKSFKAENNAKSILVTWRSPVQVVLRLLLADSLKRV